MLEKQTIKVSIYLLILLLLSTSIAFSSTTREEEQLYLYPVNPESSEWEYLDHIQMIDACQLPKEYLDSATTEYLLKTALNYPLFVDMFAFDDISEGFEIVVNNFNGLRELLAREDAIEALKEYYEDEYLNSLNDSDSETIVRKMEFEFLCSYFSYDIKNTLISSLSELTNNKVKTPNGTKVPHYEYSTYSDRGTTSSAASALESVYANRYPTAVKLSNKNPQYNCHSYAWHSTSTSNHYWIDNPKYYWNDGSYSSHNTAAINDKIVYKSSSGSFVHSGIIKSVSSGIIVRSKGGYLGVYAHLYSKCPYYASSFTYKYYN